VFLAFTAVSAVLALLVYAPVRREPFAALTFTGTFLVGEVPVHAALVVAAGTAALGDQVPSHGAVWWLALALGVGAALGYAGLAVTAHRSAGLVDAALDSASGGPIRAEASTSRRRGRRGGGWCWPSPSGSAASVGSATSTTWATGSTGTSSTSSSAGRPAERAPVLLYIHGGAWVIGDKREQGIPMMHELAQRGWVCVAINYRLSPKATWPDHIVDCKRAIAWVRDHIAEYGGDPSFLALSGGSAGGHLSALAAVTANDPEWQPGFEDADTSVDACIPFYGVHDMTGSPEAEGAYGHGLMELLEKRVMKLPYVDNTPVYDRASPDQRITPGAPPMFVIQGTNDTWCRPR